MFKLTRSYNYDKHTHHTCIMLTHCTEKSHGAASGETRENRLCRIFTFGWVLLKSIPHLSRLFCIEIAEIICYATKTKALKHRKNNEIDLSTECDQAE